MTDSLIGLSVKVSFPNLGENNVFTRGFDLNRVIFKIPGLNIDIYWYGFLIGMGVLLAIFYGYSKFEKFGINPDKATDCIIGGIIGAVIGARLYFVIFSWSNYFYDEKIHWKEIISTRDGGLAVYGGIIGGLLVGGLIAKWRKIKITPLFDIASMGLLIGQAIGRWGNFINQEAFGTNTKLPWGMTSDTIITYLSKNVINIQNKTGIIVHPLLPVHPCFLYESIWCIIGFIVLSIYMKHRKFDGEIFLIYVGWYGLGRVFIEGLRTDSLFISGTQIRVSQLLAGTCVVIAVVLIAVFRNKIKNKGSYEFFYETEISKQQIEEYKALNRKSKTKQAEKDNKNMTEYIDNAVADSHEKDDEVNIIDILNDDDIDDDGDEYDDE